MPHDLTTAGERVRAAEQAIKEARQRKREAERRAQEAYDADIAPHRQLLADLARQFEERAFELAEDDAPVSRGRMPLPPDAITVTPEGIELFWDGDRPSDTVTRVVSWEELRGEPQGGAGVRPVKAD